MIFFATRRLRALCLALGLMLSWLPKDVEASAHTRVFLMTSSYGVMSGSLIGLASLAFFEHPSEHMKNIAIGASMGLYGGILLGAYMIYVVPDMHKSPRREDPGEIELDTKLEHRVNEAPAIAWQPYATANEQGSFLGGLALRF